MKRKIKARLSPVVERLLICLLTPIVLVLIVTVFTVSSLNTYDAARLYPLFVDIMEHILMSLLIAVDGSLLLDIEIKRK